MPLINSIPKRIKEGFTELSNLSEDDFKQIEEILDEAEMVSNTDLLSENVSNTTGIDKELITKIFISVGGLMPFLEKESDVNEVVEDIMRLSSKELVTVEPKILSDRLLSLIQNKKIFYASKAEDLISENSNTFISGRIISDIRPVFDLNTEKEPEVGIIIHTLHLHYRSGYESPHKDIYLSLDTSDIITLIEMFTRAIQKDESLSELMKNKGLTNLNN